MSPSDQKRLRNPSMQTLFPGVPRALQMASSRVWLLGAILMLLVGCASEEERADAHLDNARDYLAAGDLPLASVELRNALRLDPERADAHVLQANLLRQENDWPGARTSLERAVSLAPDHLEAQRTLAQLYLLQGDLRRAITAIEAARTLAPEDPEILLLAAGWHLRRGELDGARRELETVLAGHPEHPDAMATGASIALAEGDLNTARAMLEQAAASHPDYLPIQLLRLQLMHAQGEEAAVVSTLRTLIDAQPTEFSLYRMLAAYQAAGTAGMNAAAETLRQAVRSNPDNTEARLALARLLAASDPEQAVAALTEMLAADAGNLELQLALADLQRRLGAADTAESAYRELLERDEGMGQRAALRLAAMELDRERLDEAAGLLDRVLARNDRQPQALLMRAKIHLAADNIEAAQDLSARLQRVTPDSVDAFVLSAEIHLARQQTGIARERLVRALELEPAHQQAVLLYAQLLLDADNAARAGQILVRALSERPDNYQLARKLLDVRVAQDDWNGARALLTADGPLAAHRHPAALQYLDAQRALADGENERALQLLTALGDSHPDWLAPARQRLALLISMQRLDAAASVAQATLEHHPEHLETRLRLAALYERLGDPSAARTQYETVLQQHPGTRVAANNLASLIVRERTSDNELAEAFELVRNFADADNAAYLNTLGWIQLLRGEAEAARSLLQRAHDQAPESRRIRCHLALARSDRGAEVYDQALSACDPFTQEGDVIALLQRLTAQSE